MYEDKNLKDNYIRDYNINHSDNSDNSSISEKESVCISTVEDEYVLKKHPIYKYSKKKNEDVEDAEIITFWKRLKPVLFLFFIVCLVFVHIEGNPKYAARKGKWWSITKARKMFFIGRYRDAYFCYIHSKGPLSSKDLDYQKVANIMKENFTKKKFRIFFRTPNLPIISNGKNGNDENDTLSDDIKNEIYSIAENYKNEEYVVANKNMSKYEEAALCYKVCGDDFKDSKEKSKKCLIDYVQYCKNKGDFVKAEEIINRLEQNEITKNLLQNVYETSYKTAKENYNKCFYKIAKEQFSYLAKRNFKDSEEMSRLCEQLLRYRLAITIDNGFNFDTLNYSYFKEYTNAIDYMVYYFKKTFGLTDFNEIFESARSYFKDFGEKAFVKILHKSTGSTTSRMSTVSLLM